MQLVVVAIFAFTVQLRFVALHDQAVSQPDERRESGAGGQENSSSQIGFSASQLIIAVVAAAVRLLLFSTSPNCKAALVQFRPAVLLLLAIFRSFSSSDDE